ncbi:MAG: polysaccharide biosynthesis C-terminal domain-containing protein [Clostridia bacterium]|nr:polysaccharide biosynthesis C-terminal domain-containing protein [Clostridia bacterium]MCF0190624.1 polysaccharide biosynthesis C-terminal domain-containing protein [Marinilabiliaceae bacterium]
MSKLSSLASDTVVYGASTILGRVLNWLLMPFYIRIIPKYEYGEVVNTYSIIAILLVLVTLGFETGYFRFVTTSNRNILFNTLSVTIFLFGSFITLLLSFFSDFFSSIFQFNSSSFSIILLLSLIVLVDSYNSIYFADLRFEKKSIKYSLLRLLQVILTIILNIIFLFYLRYLNFFGIDFSSFGDVQYILLANLLGSVSSLFFFLPAYLKSPKIFDFNILKSILVYCIPLVGMGFFGIANQEIEKLLIPVLDNSSDPHAQLAIYGANFKIGVLMAIFTQSFRLAFEPFFFKENKSKNTNTQLYADAMKYFVIFGLLIFASVILFLPFISLFLTSSYLEGNIVIPIILLSQLLFGIYYNLSIWYKLTDKTYFGIIFSCSGLLVNIVVNFYLIPIYGYVGAAISSLISYFVMVILSIVFGNKYYYINYPILKILFLSLCTIGITALFYYIMTISKIYWLVWAVLGIFSILVLFYFTEKNNILKLLKYGKHKN